MGFVLPGQLIANSQELKPGAGTFESNRSVFSMVLGKRTIENDTVSVVQTHRLKTAPLEIGTLILARVTKLSPKLVAVDLLDHPKLRGSILLKDVGIPGTTIEKSFRLGDILRCTVVLITFNSVILSTRDVNCGVVVCKSLSGYPMYSISWEQMKCTRTGQVEPRKCAKTYTTILN